MMRKIILALSLFLSTSAFAQNYQATQGAGTTFGSKLVGGVNYAQFVVCDPTTPAQCAAVDASGRLTLVPNTAMNIAQINGVTPLMGNGVTGTGSQRVTIASDNTAFSVNAIQSGTWTVQPGNTANTTPWLQSISQGGNTAIVKAGNTFAASDVALGVAVTNTLASVTPGDGITTTIYGTAPASPVIGSILLWNGTSYDRLKSAGATGVLSARQTDGTRSAIIDPCEANVQSYATGVITSATTTRIIAPSASNKTYLCMFFTKASAADNVGVVEGTGGTCGTGTAALLGGTTAANGLVFGTAGDGVLLQAGGKVAVMQTAGTNVDTCLITTTTGPLIWSAKYVQAP